MWEHIYMTFLETLKFRDIELGTVCEVTVAKHKFRKNATISSTYHCTDY